MPLFLPALLFEYLKHSVRPVTPGAMIHARLVTLGARIHGCGRTPRFVPRVASPHGEWPSAYLIKNNSKTIRDTLSGIFVKGPWYSTFIATKYEYSTQNSFSVKLKFAGKCGQSLRSMLFNKFLTLQFLFIFYGENIVMCSRHTQCNHMVMAKRNIILTHSPIR